MNHQDKKEKIYSGWMASPIVLRYSKEENQDIMRKTERFAAIASDVLIRKLLEVQKEGFTEDSYELLQRVIFNAISTRSMDVVRLYDDLITAAGRLQTKPFIVTCEVNSFTEKEKPVKSATSILRNTLQAIIFNVNQFPYKQMTERSVEQINQTIQFAKEAIDDEKTTKHELVFSLRSILGALLDIELIKTDNVTNS